MAIDNVIDTTATTVTTTTRNVIMTPQSIDRPQVANFYEAALMEAEELRKHPEVSDFEERMKILKTLADKAGIRLPETRVPEGSALWPSGEARLADLKNDYAKLPTFEEGIKALLAQIRRESPHDAYVPIQRVRLTGPIGKLYGEVPNDPERTESNKQKALCFTKDGINDILNKMKVKCEDGVIRTPSFESFMLLNHDQRVNSFNEWASTSMPKPESCRRCRGRQPVMPGCKLCGGTGLDPVVLRTIKDPNGKRVVRAVTSTIHSLEMGDDPAIIAAIKDIVPAGGKLRVTRSFDRTDFEIIWPTTNYGPNGAKVGDILNASILISHSEIKKQALVVDGRVLRILCYNLTTAYSEGGDEELSIRHVGDLRGKLPGLFRKAIARIEPFVVAFGDAYTTPIVGSRNDVLVKVRKKFAKEIPSDTVKLAASLWDADGDMTAGNTLAGLGNALTRAARQLPMDLSANVQNAVGRIISVGWDSLN